MRARLLLAALLACAPLLAANLWPAPGPGRAPWAASGPPPEYTLDGSITCDRTTGVAPFMAACAVTGLDTDDDATPNEWEDDYLRARIVWDYGEPSAPEYEYGLLAESGLPSPSNSTYGFEGGFVYESSGSKTITATWTAPNGAQGQATQAITVDAYSGTTYCFRDAGDGDFSDDANACSGATQQTQPDFDAALATCLGAGARRCLFRRGDTFALSGETTLPAGPGIVGAFGAGANPRPIVTGSGPAFASGGADWRIVDLDFNGPGSLAGSRRLFLRTTFRNGPSGTIGVNGYGDGQNGFWFVRSTIEDFGTSGNGAGLYAMHSWTRIMGSKIVRSGTQGTTHNARVGMQPHFLAYASEVGEGAGNQFKMVGEGNSCGTTTYVQVSDFVVRQPHLTGYNTAVPVGPQGCNGSGADCGDDFLGQSFSRILLDGIWCRATGGGASGGRRCIETSRATDVAIRNVILNATEGYANGVWVRNQSSAGNNRPAACSGTFPVATNPLVSGLTFVWSSGTPADAEDVILVDSGQTAKTIGNLVYTSSSGDWGSVVSCSGTCSPNTGNVRVTANPFDGSHPFETIDEFELSSARNGTTDTRNHWDALGRERVDVYDAGALEFQP